MLTTLTRTGRSQPSARTGALFRSISVSEKKKSACAASDALTALACWLDHRAASAHTRSCDCARSTRALRAKVGPCACLPDRCPGWDAPGRPEVQPCAPLPDRAPSWDAPVRPVVEPCAPLPDRAPSWDAPGRPVVEPCAPLPDRAPSWDAPGRPVVEPCALPDRAPSWDASRGLALPRASQLLDTGSPISPEPAAGSSPRGLRDRARPASEGRRPSETRCGTVPLPSSSAAHYEWQCGGQCTRPKDWTFRACHRGIVR
jgi:hypothetical protein